MEVLRWERGGGASGGAGGAGGGGGGGGGCGCGCEGSVVAVSSKTETFHSREIQ